MFPGRLVSYSRGLQVGPFIASLAFVSLLLDGTLHGQIVINEILQNPSAVADADGEWFEVFNPTASGVDINGWTIEDNDSDSHVITNGGPLMVPAGGFLVLGNNGNSGTNGGVTVDYVFSGIAVANGADELVLRNGALAEIDRVEWDGGATFPDPNGASMSLISPVLDNNLGGNWCTASTPFGDGDLGTPGAANSCPAPVLVINEIDYDQPGTDDAEFIEIKNVGSSAANLGNFSLQLVTGANGAIYRTIALPSVSLGPGGYFVVCGNAANTANCDLDVSPDTNLIQNGAPDAVGLLEDSTLVDAVSYEGNTVSPFTEGSGVGLEDSPAQADSGISRCPDGSDTEQNNLDLEFQSITPGADNACGVPVVVINEIMQNPSAVSESNGEWFELLNPTSTSIDINGWTIADNDSDSHVIGGPLLIPAGGFLVLGRNDDSGTNGGVTVDYEFSGVFLGNGSDELVLLDTALNEVDRVEWDNGATFPDPNGASMSLRTFLLDNNLGANWCRASTRFGDGDFGTPGATNDCPLPPILINEVDADSSGSDDMEFVELYDGGAGNTPLDGLVVVFFNGNGDVSYRAIDLGGFMTNSDGFFLLGNSAVFPSPDLIFPNNGLQNGADAVALYVGGAISFPNGTPVTTDNLIDALVYDTNDGDDPGLLLLLNAGQPQVNEDGEGDKDNDSNQRCPNGFGGVRNANTYVQAASTPGVFNECPPLEIFEIQGATQSSPFEGLFVNSANNVVTCLATDGFFIQTPTSRSDGDIDTSDGIFVFTGGAPSVQVGDLVDVTARVDEFFGFTELTNVVKVGVVGSGTVPSPVTFDVNVPSPDPTAPSCAIEFECYEGMLIEISGGAVSGPNQRFGPDPIAEVHIVAGPVRAFREPGVEFPGLMMPPIPTWDGNPEVFELDPDKLGLPNQIIPAGSSFSATGVLGFEFGGYELWPNQLTVDPAPLPVAVGPRQEGEFTVGTLNMFRFFDDVNFERRRAKFALYILDVLDAPDILAVQEAEKVEVLQSLATEISLLDPSVNYTAFLVEGNDIGTIDVGFLVRDTVIVDAVT